MTEGRWREGQLCSGNMRKYGKRKERDGSRLGGVSESPRTFPPDARERG